VGEGLGVCQIVGGNDLYIRVVHRGPENVSANSAEAVDADFGGSHILV
jgi:hypothetical protein